MGNPLPLQVSVAVFAGLAAAMIVPSVRRSVPRWIEAVIWLSLIVSCWLAITNIQEVSTKNLTAAAAWGADQIVNTAFGLLFAGIFGWLVDHRFAIANAVVVVAGADILFLTMLRSHRRHAGRHPRVMLGEWVELPLRRAPALAPAPVPYAVDEWNRRVEGAMAILGAAFLTWLVNLLIWTRDVFVPQARVRQTQAVASGWAQAAAGLESLRERAIRARLSAWDWHAKNAPAINDFTARAGRALDRAVVGDASVVDVGSRVPLSEEQMGTLRALLSAQSIGWYGPIVPAPSGISPEREEGQEDESDRLAS
jgi:hypothetical protein